MPNVSITTWIVDILQVRFDFEARLRLYLIVASTMVSAGARCYFAIRIAEASTINGKPGLVLGKVK